MTVIDTLSQLRPQFVKAIRTEARAYAEAQGSADAHQWAIGALALAEWREQYSGENGGADEMPKMEFYQLASEAINSALPFPIVAQSGHTLRLWMSIVETYEHTDTAIRDALTYQHFRNAKRLAAMPENEGKNPDYFLAQAITGQLTADEMLEKYDPKRSEPVHEYDRVVGWLDSLQTAKLSWIRDAAQRKAFVAHATAMRRIIEANQ